VARDLLARYTFRRADLLRLLCGALRQKHVRCGPRPLGDTVGRKASPAFKLHIEPIDSDYTLRVDGDVCKYHEIEVVFEYQRWVDFALSH
jgi:hypothetical protein